MEGLPARFATMGDYYKFISAPGNVKEHLRFLASRKEWIRQHCAAPSKARCTDAAFTPYNAAGPGGRGSGGERRGRPAPPTPAALTATAAPPLTTTPPAAATVAGS